MGLRFASVTGTEHEITADLVAALLREQHPDPADLPLTFGARGWDNQLWRLGSDLAVRLPWALACLLIGDAGVHGRPGGKATWGPPAVAALQRLTATRPSLS